MKTNLGLVNYCKEQLGKPYWWGTFGQKATESLYNQKKKQYPSQYTADDFKKQFGAKVHDCVGLIKGYRWSKTPSDLPEYVKSQDKDVSGMLKDCNIKGSISTIPETKGILVFFTGHVGVYIGNGEVIEARGHKYGVVKTKLKQRPWTQWGIPNWLTIIESEGDEMLNEFISKYGKEKVKEGLDILFKSVSDDGKPAEWAEKEFEEAKKNKITDGTKPEMFATRQEVAIMVKRAMIDQKTTHEDGV